MEVVVYFGLNFPKFSISGICLGLKFNAPSLPYFKSDLFWMFFNGNVPTAHGLVIAKVEI